MPFARNSAVPEEVGNFFGEYDSTFISDSGQVRAELFRRNGAMIAYLSFVDGGRKYAATDADLASLEAHAAEAGLAGKLRIVFAEN